MSLKDAFLTGCVLPTDVVIQQGRDGDVVAIRSIEGLAREIAGCFFEGERSQRFRKKWGTSDKSQQRYINQHWQTFIKPARQMLSQRLGDPSVPETEKERIYHALIADRVVDQAVGRAAGQTQLEPGTEAFDGDKFLNRETDALDS
jgi:hypothetical protein